MRAPYDNIKVYYAPVCTTGEENVRLLWPSNHTVHWCSVARHGCYLLQHGQIKNLELSTRSASHLPPCTTAAIEQLTEVVQSEGT